MALILKKTITETFLERVRKTPDVIGFQYKPTYAELGPVGQWKGVSFKEFFHECRLVSLGLMELGIKPKDKVAILSNTRFEWSLADMAILGSGAITIPIYASNTPDDVVYILNHSEARIAFIEDAKQLQKIFDKRAEKADCLPHLEKVILLDPAAMRLAAEQGEGLKSAMTLQALRELGKRGEGKDGDRFENHLATADAQDLITICYTSGTTGIPKGVMITHDNLMSVLEDCVKALEGFITAEKEVVLTFLPYSHIFGKVESLAVYTFGWRAVYAESIDKLMTNIAEIKPTFLFSVPRIFEKAYNRIQATVEASSPLKKKLFELGLGVGRQYYEKIWNQTKPSLKETISYLAIKKLVFQPIAQRFGGRLRFAICGGAPLPQEIGEFFQIVGIKILEGYGLTETCAPVAINLPGDPRFGVVGAPLAEVTFRVAPDGELLIKSRKVFQGYYKMESETKEALTEGWFHTGDIGHLDQDNFLHITDRKKDLIVTSGGKNVAPQKIEQLARSQKMISQFVVHGDRRNYLTALVTLNQDQVIEYANAEQILFSEYSELIKHPKIILLVQKMVDDVNRQLASFESVKKFIVLPIDFTVEGGELTPSLKVRRAVINKRYKAELDSMYQETGRVSVDSSHDIH